MKSKIVRIKPPSRVMETLSRISKDRLPLFAAQSSFFICISAIPFIMLILSLARVIVPDLTDDLIEIVRGAIPASSHELFDLVISDIIDKAAFPLISVAAVSTLWASSRGLLSVVRGVSEVYGKKTQGSFLSRLVKAVVYTAIFIVVFIAALLILVFGKYLKDTMTSSIGDVPMFLKYKEVISFFVLTLFFTLLYFFVAKGVFSSPLFKWEKGSRVKFRRQIPGAALAAAGWILFSFFYSLYFENFPRLSYLYGSLAAIVFFMLWVYFCMLILLAGAEINKLLFERSAEKQAQKKPE